MKKTIKTLIKDINSVIDGKGGWDEVVNEHFKETIGDTLMSRLNPEERKEGTLRMSSIGQPCERKLWYQTNKPKEGETLRSEIKFKFLYGDILEDLILSLAVAAGHKVEGHQDTMDIMGIKGHRDAVIDGVTVDVKSASTYSFKKFRDHQLETDDPFGYLTQLSSYVYAAKSDPLVKDKNGGAFLAVDKQHGHICLDYYDFKKTGHLKNVEKLYADRIKSANDKTQVPDRSFSPIPEGKSGNLKLGTNCSYCDYKWTCHPDLRAFLYSRGPVFLTKVVREPNVTEVT